MNLLCSVYWCAPRGEGYGKANGCDELTHRSVRPLLSIEQKYLDPSVELKRIFGASIIEREKKSRQQEYEHSTTRALTHVSSRCLKSEGEREGEREEEEEEEGGGGGGDEGGNCLGIGP